MQSIPVLRSLKRLKSFIDVRDMSIVESMECVLPKKLTKSVFQSLFQIKIQNDSQLPCGEKLALVDTEPESTACSTCRQFPIPSQSQQDLN